jgi:hypothetical protein
MALTREHCRPSRGRRQPLAAVAWTGEPSATPTCRT